MNYYAHAQSIIEPGASVGARSRVWAFAHILTGATIGEDCNICDHVFIEGDVIVGDRSTIKCGVQLWNGLRVGPDVFVGPNATFTNDRFPRSRRHQDTPPRTVLEAGCSIGANATILPGVVVGRNAMVGAGAVVTKSVPPHAIVFGNPAEISGYDNTVASVDQSPDGSVVLNPSIVLARVRGVALHQLPLVQDLRGDLSVGEFSKSVPFLPKRYFIVFNVKSREVRGEHAHHTCLQFMVCVAGSCRIAVDDGTNRDEYTLDTPTRGLFLPALTWATQYRYSTDAILLVFASEHYDPDDYIRDYSTFLQIATARRDASGGVDR